MEVKAVSNIKLNYPTLEEFLQDSNLLNKNIPQSWIKNKVIAGALSVFLLSGCKEGSKIDDIQVDIVNTYDICKDGVLKTHEELFLRHKIAPIFIHGNGTGALGCMVMSFPVYISENEAKSIIIEELKKHDLIFDTIIRPELTYNLRKRFFNHEDGKLKIDYKSVKIDRKLIAYNKSLNIGIEYVSSETHYLLQEYKKRKKNDRSSVWSENYKQTAEYIRRKLIWENKYNAVVFYDPLVKDRDFFSKQDTTKLKTEKEPKEIAKEKLLAQVADFIKWVKKEGLLK